VFASWEVKSWVVLPTIVITLCSVSLEGQNAAVFAKELGIGKIVARPVQPEITKVLDEPDRLIEAVIKFVADSDDALPFIIGMRRVADVAANGNLAVGIG
jgi:hypothetical protein